MTLQSDVIQYLSGLGTAAGARVYDEQVPEKAPFPFLAVGLVSNTTPTTLNGTNLFSRAQIRVAVFTANAVDRDSIAAAIKAAVDTWRLANLRGGLLGETRVVTFRFSRSSDEVSFVDGDALVKGAALDLFFLYQE